MTKGSWILAALTDPPQATISSTSAEYELSLRLTPDEAVRLWSLSYDESIETLRLRPGPTDWKPEPAYGLRAVEALPALVARTTIGGGGNPAWEFLDLAPAPEIFFPVTRSLDECLRDGYCFRDEAQKAIGDCGRRCQGFTVTPPAPPNPPALVPPYCASNWVMGTWPGAGPISELTWCAPPPPTACPLGMSERRGGCESLGAPCPTGEWPEPLPDGPKRFVRAGAIPGGDGTQDRPYGAIQEALGRVVPGDVVVLAKGLYEFAGVVSTPNVSIVGACPVGTLIVAPPSQTALQIERSVVLKNVTVESRDAPAVTLDRFATAVVEGVLVSVSGVAPAVGLAGGARLSGIGMLVQSTGPAFHLDGAVDLEGVELRSVGGIAVDVRSSGQLKLVNLRVQGSIVHRGVSVILSDGVIEGPGLAMDQSGSGDLSLVRIYTSGGLKLEGGSVSLTSVSVEGAGVTVQSSAVTLAGLRIREPKGVGLEVEESDLSGSGLVILGALGGGLRAKNGSLDLSDLVLLDTHADPAAPQEKDGSGIWIDGQDEAYAWLRRLVVARADGSGLLQKGSGAQGINDLHAEDIGAGPDRTGAGLASSGPGRAEINRASIHRVQGTALWQQGPFWLQNASSLDISDAGIGIRIPGRPTPWTEDPARLSAVRVVRSGAVGLCLGQNVRVTASSLHISTTGGQDPPLDDCNPPGPFAGVGVSIGSQADLQLSNFNLEDNPRAIVQSSVGELTLSYGTFTRNGVVYEVPGLEAKDVLLNILYLNNDRIWADR